MTGFDNLANEFSILAAPYDAASKKKQRQWGKFPEAKKQQLRKTHADKDKDGVPDIWDCQPRNPFRQDRFSETQIAEIKDLGTLEAGAFIGRGGFGAVYGLKAKDPAKQHIADKYVVKVGLDAYQAHTNDGLLKKEKKLLNFWESTEGHKPTLERLHKKTRTSETADMEVLDEYREYKREGFADLSLMIPSEPTTVEMGDFRTFAMIKPKVEVVGERVHRVKKPQAITPEIIDQLQAGTLEFSGAGQGIWDYMQFGIGDKDGEEKAWIYDTGVVRKSSDAHAMNTTTWKGFARAVNAERADMNVNPELGPKPAITPTSKTEVDEENLEELADWVDDKWGWPPWDVETETRTKLRYSRKKNIVNEDGNIRDGKYVLSVGKAPFGGSGWSLDIYHDKIVTCIFHTTFQTAKEAVVGMHKIAQTIELTTSPQTPAQIRAFAGQIVDNLEGKVDLKTVKNKAGSRKAGGPVWGEDWGKWTVSIQNDSEQFLRMDWNNTYFLIVYKLDGRSEWRISLQNHVTTLAMVEVSTKQKAVILAHALSKSSMFSEGLLDDELELEAQRFLDARAGKATTKRTPTMPSKPVWGKPWGKWSVQLDDRSGNFLIMENGRYAIGIFEADGWTVSFQKDNTELVVRYYSTEEKALGAAHRLAQSKMFDKTKPEHVKEKAEAILDLNGGVSKTSLHKNLAVGHDWGSWNVHTNNPVKLILTYDVAGYAFHYKISVGKDNNHLRISKVWPETTEELYSGFFGPKGKVEAVDVAHEVALVVDKSNSKSVAGTDERMLKVIDKYQKKAGWTERTAPVSDIMQFNKFHDEDGNTKAWLAVEEPVPGKFGMQFVAKGDSAISDKIRRRGNIDLMDGGDVDRALDEILVQNSLHGGFGQLAGFETAQRLGAVQGNLKIPDRIISGPNVFNVEKVNGTNGTVWYFHDKNGTKLSLSVRKYGYGGVNKGYKIHLSKVARNEVLFDKVVPTAEGTIKAVKELIHRHNIGAAITNTY